MRLETVDMEKNFREQGRTGHTGGSRSEFGKRLGSTNELEAFAKIS